MLECNIMKPYLSSHLKDMNRRSVYRMFCEVEETSKSEISRVTGISAPTVIKIINFFIEKGLVREFGEGISALGRKPQMLCLNKNRYYSIGVAHEGNYLKVGIVNLIGETVALKKVRVKESFEQVMGAALFAIINQLLVESNIQLSDILGIGVGIPGIYDVERKRIMSAPLIGITEETDIGYILEALSNQYHLEVVADNDLNMEAMGEFIALKLDDSNDLIHLSLGTGIGSGVILNGHLRRGNRYMCGEIGYMSFMDDYVARREDAGWLESKINLDALQKEFSLSEEGFITSKDKEAAIAYVSTLMSLCINNIVMCYDCDNISIGGELLDLLGNRLFTAIEEKVKKMSIWGLKLHKESSSNLGVLGAAGVVTDKAIKRILSE